MMTSSSQLSIAHDDIIITTEHSIVEHWQVYLVTFQNSWSYKHARQSGKQSRFNHGSRAAAEVDTVREAETTETYLTQVTTAALRCTN